MPLPSKQEMRVRFSPPAPEKKTYGVRVSYATAFSGFGPEPARTAFAFAPSAKRPSITQRPHAASPAIDDRSGPTSFALTRQNRAAELARCGTDSRRGISRHATA